MEKMQFKTTLNAPREKVWDALWGETTYQQWTAPFAEGSKAVTDWKKGSKVLFLDANNDGMVSVIEESIPNEYMSIRHIGHVKNGVEDTESKEVENWKNAYENYTLKDAEGKTELIIDMTSANMPQEYLDYFNKTWPKALDKLKEIAEKN